MIAGIANYRGDPLIESACHAATAGIDAAIDDMLPVRRASPDLSLLGVMLSAGLPEDSIRANLKLAISGGQNEPRHAIVGTVWALLTHPEQRAMLSAGTLSCGQAFDEYVRWISPIGMSPRRIARQHCYRDISFKPGERAFLMFGAANRDEAHFEKPDEYNATRDNSRSIPFGAGPHFCAGASISRTMIAEVALPALFSRMRDLALAPQASPRIAGWAFRGLQNLPVEWI
jgi:cytochrome P450